MKALVYRRFGPPEVVGVEEVPNPEPGARDVRVRVHATAVTTSDASFRAGKPFSARLFAGPVRPRLATLGSLVAGAVDAVGPGVTRMRVGDRVLGFTGSRLGAHAEYVRLPEDGVLAPTPANLTDAEAVAVCEGTMTALPFLRDEANLRAGQTILVNGAAGSVGSAAVQLAKHFGAYVVGVCSSGNVDRVCSLGADEVIDYTTEDFTRGGEAYDVIFDAVGKSSFARCRGRLRPGGIYLTTVPSPSILWQARWTRRRAKRAAIAFTGLRAATAMAQDLVLLTQLAAAGQITPVIDGTYPLRAAADAHRRVDSGHKAGTVVLTMIDA